MAAYVGFSRTGHTRCDTSHRTSILILLFLLPLKRAGHASGAELPRKPYIHVELECDVQEGCVLLDVEPRLAVALSRQSSYGSLGGEVVRCRKDRRDRATYIGGPRHRVDVARDSREVSDTAHQTVLTRLFEPMRLRNIDVARVLVRFYNS